MTILASAMLMSAAALTSSFAAEGATPAGVKDEGGMLTGEKGMTLYTWDNDKTADKSSCNAMCAMNWPALKADASAKDMGAWKVITRDDGSKQWAYKGKPLYYFAKDAAAGDKKGDNAGKGMIWHVAKM
jgi:predicted lipoprotein with Yx(FWY)xxD motif